jgi:hypothetical protein
MTKPSPNFRVIRHEYKGDTWQSVHEVHHDEDGKPLRFMADPLPSVTADDDGPGAAAIRAAIKTAESLPVLDAQTDFPERTSEATAEQGLAVPSRSLPSG